MTVWFDARRSRAALAWRPELWLIAPAVAAWAIVVSASLPGYSGHSGHAHGAHAHSAVHMPTPLSQLSMWAVMSAAMMIPLAMPAVRHVGLNSAPGRRLWAMTLSVTAYLSVWLLFGAGALTAAAALTPVEPGVVVVALLLTAACWQLTRWKRRALISHGNPVPLPPCGLRADRACLRLGVRHGARCVLTCWPYMAIMAFVGHSLVWMIALSALTLVEARAAAPDHARRRIAWVLLLATVVGACFVVL